MKLIFILSFCLNGLFFQSCASKKEGYVSNSNKTRKNEGKLVGFHPYFISSIDSISGMRIIGFSFLTHPFQIHNSIPNYPIAIKILENAKKKNEIVHLTFKNGTDQIIKVQQATKEENKKYKVWFTENINR